ncbi:unnamed protein product [Polarella glacialis]|uniref:General transcription factor 3C polypeptide 3 n=2 Tax=Polarella glacialis TaxID=89957 RepID=A0A813JKT5_POLGL|nr:unnamed protein product [Polarella glacialis]
MPPKGSGRPKAKGKAAPRGSQASKAEDVDKSQVSPAKRRRLRPAAQEEDEEPGSESAHLSGAESEPDAKDSDFDSSDLDAVLMSVGGQAELAESGMMAQKWNKRRKMKRTRKKASSSSKRGAADEDSDGAGEEEDGDAGGGASVKRAREGKAHSMASPQVRGILAQGQAEFAQGDFDKAVESMRAVIRAQPGLADPYHILALIYEERGEEKKAVDALLLSAYMTSSATEARSIWRKVASMSSHIGLLDQACYAFKRSISRAGGRGDDDLKAMWDLSQLLFKKGSVDRGIEVLYELYEETGENSLACEVAKKLIKRHRWQECLALLEACVEKGRRAKPSRVDLTVLNYFCEVLMEVRDFEKCATLLIELFHLREPLAVPSSSTGATGSGSSSSSGSTALALFPASSTSSSTALALVPGVDMKALVLKLQARPIDLVAKLAAALCRLRTPASDGESVDPLCTASIEVVLTHPAETHQDLYLLIVDALLQEEGATASTVSQRWPRRSNVRAWSAEQALRILNLLETTDFEEDLRERRAMCLWRLGQVEEAAMQLEALLELSPGDRDLRVRVAEAWIEHGDPQRADKILSTLSYEDLQRSNRVPPALSAADRRALYQELSETMERVLSAATACGKPEAPHEQFADEQEIQSFIARFRHLIYDCELDYKRLSSYSSNAAAARAASGNAEEEDEEAEDAGTESTKKPSSSALAVAEVASKGTASSSSMILPAKVGARRKKNEELCALQAPSTILAPSTMFKTKRGQAANAMSVHE